MACATSAMASGGGGSADVQIRLTLIRDGTPEVVTVRLPTTAYQACTHFNEEFLRLLFSNNIPEWIASAYQTRTLYLFSERPVPKSKGGDPQNLQKQKNYKGDWWNTTDKEDITTLKQLLSKPGDTPLYLAKVCKYCTQKDSETLFVLKTKDYFDRGHCHIKACQHAANAAAAAAATAPWGKYLHQPPPFRISGGGIGWPCRCRARTTRAGGLFRVIVIALGVAASPLRAERKQVSASQQKECFLSFLFSSLLLLSLTHSCVFLPPICFLHTPGFDGSFPSGGNIGGGGFLRLSAGITSPPQLTATVLPQHHSMSTLNNNAAEVVDVDLGDGRIGSTMLAGEVGGAAISKFRINPQYQLPQHQGIDCQHASY